MTPVIRANKTDVWGGLEGFFGWARLGGQVGYSDVSATDSAFSKFNRHGVRWQADVAFKLGDSGTWLGATYGTANGNNTDLNDRTFLLTVYFAPPGADALFGNKIKGDDSDK
jgi:hypothetical protein